MQTKTELEKLREKVKYMKTHRCEYHTEKYYLSLKRQLERYEASQ